MRALSFLLLLLSLPVLAQDFETRLKALEKSHGEEDYELRKKTNFDGKYPNDDYVKAFPALNDQHLAQVLKLYEDECAKTKTNCLSDADKNLKAMQTRISNGLVERRNQWAREGVTIEERKKKEEEYKKEETARGAQGGGGRKPTTETVIPDKKTEVVVKPDDKKTDPTPSGAAEELKKQSDEVNKAIQVLEDEYKKKFANAEITNDNLEALKAFESAKLNMTLAMYKNLCEKFPKDETVCLKPEIIKSMQEGTDGVICHAQRKNQYLNATDKSKMKEVGDQAAHNAEWAAMNPKDCKKLLAGDILPVKPDNTPVTTDDPDQESEDKRNYKSAECKWVVNMPRKVVTGATCGKSKNNICVGYVSCPRKTGPGSFTRMSTCRASYCGNEDAVKCTQDPGYWSRKPTGEDKEFVSPEVKKVLRTSRQ